MPVFKPGAGPGFLKLIQYNPHATSYSMESACEQPLVASQVITQQMLSVHLFHFECAFPSQVGVLTCTLVQGCLQVFAEYPYLAPN